MSRRGTFFRVGGLLAGLLAFLFLIYGLASQSAPPAPRPPELGGQKVPATVYDIRFDRRYDLFCSFYGKEPKTFRNCTILGFTGHGEGSTGSGQASGSGVFFLSSGSGSSYNERYFDHWVVIKLADGRLAYIPPGSVQYIEEAAPPTE